MNGIWYTSDFDGACWLVQEGMSLPTDEHSRPMTDEEIDKMFNPALPGPPVEEQPPAMSMQELTQVVTALVEGL